MATQEKTWNVANRLHSQKDSDKPEVNHIIAGADEIYDDTKGAKQSDINAQTDAALADRYTKAETYSKEQLDSLITTPDANYVTVATFADLPQTGEANTIYRVSSYDGTQVDVSKYALYAWNDATYQLLAVRSAVGEVFDVSEYNSGATYETISAALAAVPASVQRGGMSIKFILRTNTGTEEEPVYHDEYVQYRLMSTDWSTVITDWQGVDKVPTPGSHNFVESGGVQNELALGAIYDVSAKNPTAGSNNDGKFESLSALLSDANINTLIPTAYRKGGMSIKFVQSSDNKYVQFRCIADEFTTDTTQWAIAEDGVYVENPEFVYVKTDAEGKILWAIKVDGSIYYGAGVPQQVVDYINEKIAELSLDEYEDIVAFLNGLEEGDKTLQELLDEKVNKEEGKSLIDAEYANGVRYIENPEFIEAKVDSEDKVLEGIKSDGTKVIGADLEVGGDTKILGNMEVSGVSYKVIENPEYLVAWVDAEYKVIFGLRADGKTYVGDADFLNEIKNNQEAIDEIKTTLASINSTIESLDIDALSSITAVENPEYIEATTDSEGKILAGRTPDGAAFENVGFSTPKVSIDGHTIENIEDPEGRTEIKTDAEGKILSYRDSDGVKHENAGIETIHLELKDDGLDDLGRTLKAAGYGNTMDWSDEEFVEIPIPSVCAVVNIGVYVQAESKGLDIPTYIQFWDKNGNYFKKPILLNAQGSSSMGYHIKNQAIDIDDGSKIKFGNWPAFDSFHIKKYFIDVFRGQCIVAYWLTEQMYQSKPYGEKRPWDYLNDFNDIDGANGKFAEDFDSGAMAHPDGFPVHLFFNGKDAGIYAFNIKKARGNYNMKKDKQQQIILDGVLGQKFFMANGNLNQEGEDESGNPTPTIWENFEIRNPKIATDINGNKYDGDNPKEPANTYATTKAAIERLTTAITATLAESTSEAKKSKFAEFFNIPFFIDYELISQVIYNFDGYRKNWIWCCWDGELWTPTSYDMDSIFGQDWNGASYINDSINGILGTDNVLPTGNALLKSLYQTELRARYKELRDNGIFSVNNIVSLMERWVNGCGYDNLKSDIEEIVTSPYLVNGDIVVDGSGNPVLVPNTPSYRDGNRVYAYTPTTGGWYNSILRIKNWLADRIAVLDTYYNYN